MIPIELKLRNFMTYRQADLPFQGIHLAALTGENGAGKSTLLDAITWAVWGKARARRDDELIRLGQTEMEVEFTFQLAENVYRIVRKRDASKRGRSNLSFQVEDAGGWRTLTENSLRATEKKINELLQLDYDTFINSAFLLQGRADEFTTKRPAERKKILSDILGLELYDQYAERAKKQANQKDSEAKIIEADIQRIEQELALEPQHRAELAAAEKESADLSAALETAELKLETLRVQHRAINDKQRQLDDLRLRLEQVHTDLADVTDAIRAAEAAIAENQAVQARQADIEAGLAQLQQAQAAVQDWDQRLQESVRLSTQKHQLDSAVQAARAKIEAELSAVTSTIQHLQPNVAGRDALQTQLQEAEAELAALKLQEAELEAQRSAMTALGEESARLAGENTQLKAEMDEIRENLTQLEQAGATCPVCRRPMEEAHRQQVEAEFRAEGTTKGDRWRANKSRLAEIDVEQKTVKKTIAGAEKALRRVAAVQRTVAQLEQSVRQAEADAEKLAAAEAQQTELRQQLDSRNFAADALANLAVVEAELNQLGYDTAAHDSARQQAAALRHFEDEARALAHAGERIQHETKRLERDRARHARLTEQTAADQTKIAELEQETAEFAGLSARLNEASRQLDEFQREYRFAQEKVGAAKQKLSHIAYLSKSRSKQDDKLQQVRESLGIFRELQTAFGKKGVQALLIESAIPEIENEANAILSRMTDGRMNIRFETQREAVSSDSTIETLDILISDEAGTRDYELYSGGEAFRINFAIRIAISKVLARRAGARLQTLMIDEGFGTQDAQGRERLVEAINVIQNDFEKLIVITHIDELKDAFPVRIDVWKTPDGSEIAIR